MRDSVVDSQMGAKIGFSPWRGGYEGKQSAIKTGVRV